MQQIIASPVPQTPDLEPTILRAMEITRREGYTLQEWMEALNLAAGNRPELLRTTSHILRALSADLSS